MKTKRQDPGKQAADRAVRFINALTHTKGRWAGQKFDLRPWQKHQIVRPLFGSLLPDGRRQYRTCLLMLPRKNGKSELAAAIALYLLLGEAEMGGEIYSCAADRGQAALVFDVAAQMIRNDAELASRVKIIDSMKRIVNPATTSFYRAISSEAYTKHGFNASAVIYDEVHAAPDRKLWETLTSSMGARSQPLTLAITTAGYDRLGLAYELYDYAVKVRDGIITDPTFLPIIYEAPATADWKSADVWRAANPALGDFLNEEDVKQACIDALEIPIRQNAFRRLRLNQWTEVSDRWIDPDVWRANDQPQREDVEGQETIVGLDLAATQDMSAAAILIPDSDGGYDVFMRYYLPGDNLRKRSERDHAPYPEWQRQKWLTCTEGNVQDYEFIERDLLAIAKLFRVKCIAYDRYNSSALITRLMGGGLTCVPVGTGFVSMAAPCLEFERLALSGKLRHGGNPILTWNLTNTAIVMDASGNKKPSKERSTGRIDGISALLMALNRCLVEPVKKGSVYDTQELFVI